MDFSYTRSELQFRDEIRRWLANNLPAGWGESVFEPDDEDERARMVSRAENYTSSPSSKSPRAH